MAARNDNDLAQIDSGVHSIGSDRLEWPSFLTADDLHRLRGRPAPIDEFVVKIHSRCNLACDYCYIYELGDSTWRDQPALMATDVAMQVAERIAEHAERHLLPRVFVVLHGGEPLLLGPRRLERLLTIFETTLSYVTQPSFGIQTNGILLTEELASILDRFDVAVSVSLDGNEQINDRHRIRRNGSGSYATVVDRLEAVRRGPHAHIARGLLAVIDVTNDPIETYESLCAFGLPLLDFVLPHGNWTKPPPNHLQSNDTTLYADWLIKVFDHWRLSKPPKPAIRIFDEMIRLHRGLDGSTEMLGLAPVTLAVIETDGSFGLVDTLKSAFNGAAETTLDVFTHSVDDLLELPEMAARQMGTDGLSASCRSCDLVSVCGGGYYPHRYKCGSGFLNPSVYCADLYKLISHVAVWIDREDSAIMV